MTLKPDFLVLKTLTQLPGIAGRESAVREYLQKLLAPAADEVRTDALGNLICFKKGTSDKNLLLCAQRARRGFFARCVQGNGGADAKALRAGRSHVPV